MNHYYRRYPYLYDEYSPVDVPYNNRDDRLDQNTYEYNTQMENPNIRQARFVDYGSDPFVVNIENVTKRNNAFRTALWTGNHLQLTLMSINVGESIGLEVHHHLDQFIRIEEGQGLVKMGDSEYNMDFQKRVKADFAFIIPAGKWHNLINTGDVPIKLYSIYAPPQHPRGTVHKTKAIAQSAEADNEYE